MSTKRCIKISDEFEGYDLDMFSIPSHYQNDVESVLIPNGIILDRIDRIAMDIMEEQKKHRGPLVALCVLKGGYKFFTDLCDRIQSISRYDKQSVPLIVDFIRVKSYVNTESKGDIEIVGGDYLKEIKGKNVIVIEDLIDTGNTMVQLLKVLHTYQPVDIKVACLMVKRTPKSNGFQPDFTGFEIPNKFIVGYALDYNEYFRDMSHICIINEVGKKKYAN